ncbi:MAG: ABC transporter permease [Treponema sp.]|nr:ABC transporter permease [Treponema sp.]
MNRVLSSIKWIYYVSQRFNKIDVKGRTAVTSKLAAAGIAFGVMALIAIMSVMNGFQMEFIDAIMEISSYHVQARCDGADADKFESWCRINPLVRNMTLFSEAQGLLVDSYSGMQSASLIRAVPDDIYVYDKGFSRELEIISGSFDIESDDSIVIGYDLACNLHVTVGSVVNLLAVSGSSDNALFSNDRQFIVTGIFFANYQDINGAYAFVNLNAAKKYFGSNSESFYGIKLYDSNKDVFFISELLKMFPNFRVETWRAYNRSFFGALRVEKNVLMILILLIFVVVAVNIYNSMRRMIYERRQDIAVLSALGATKTELKIIFTIKGFITGLTGSVIGLIFGIFLCINMERIFMFLAKAQYYMQYLMLKFFSPDSLIYLQENPMFSIYAEIPARMVLSEIVLIFTFGILAALFSSMAAERHLMKLTVSEVLHDE